MKRRRWFLLLVALLVGAAGAFALWPRAAGPLKASVQFLTYTNLPEGKRVGLFVLRNESGEKLRWLGGCTFGHKNGSGDFRTQVSHPPEVLRAGGAMVLLVPPPPDDPGPWSLHCSLGRCGLRARWAERLGNRATSVSWHGRVAHWLTPEGGTSVSCESAVIEQSNR